MVNDSTAATATTATATAGGTSRLALLVSFIAGAFAAWIIITINTNMQMSAEPVSEPGPIVMEKKAPPMPAPPAGGAKAP